MPSCNDTIFFLWNDENNNVLNKYCDLVKCFPYYPKIKFLSSSHHHPFDQVKKKRQTKVFNTTTLCSSWWNKKARDWKEEIGSKDTFTKRITHGHMYM